MTSNDKAKDVQYPILLSYKLTRLQSAANSFGQIFAFTVFSLIALAVVPLLTTAFSSTIKEPTAERLIALVMALLLNGLLAVLIWKSRAQLFLRGLFGKPLMHKLEFHNDFLILDIGEERLHVPYIQMKVSQGLFSTYIVDFESYRFIMPKHVMSDEKLKLKISSRLK